MSGSSGLSENRLFAKLSAAEYELLAPHLATVSLSLNEVLFLIYGSIYSSFGCS